MGVRRRQGRQTAASRAQCCCGRGPSVSSDGSLRRKQRRPTLIATNSRLLRCSSAAETGATRSERKPRGARSECDHPRNEDNRVGLRDVWLAGQRLGFVVGRINVVALGCVVERRGRGWWAAGPGRRPCNCAQAVSSARADHRVGARTTDGVRTGRWDARSGLPVRSHAREDGDGRHGGPVALDLSARRPVDRAAAATRGPRCVHAACQGSFEP